MLRSPLFVLGLAVTLVAGFFHFVLFLLDLSEQSANPYLHILYYVVLPLCFFLGLGLGGIGRKRYLRRRATDPDTGKPVPVPPLGFAALVLATLVTVLVLAFTGYSGYAVYHYTDSVGFCGSSCHTPMGPTHAAYQISPHRELSCTECHVGDGPRGFIEAKVAGTRQLIETLADSFPRPIHAPRQKLNVTREACTKCHVPANSSHFRLEHRTIIASDEANTFRPIFMALKTVGPSDLIQPRKFHWHESEIEYVAADERVTEIPWVRARGERGVRIYRSDGLPMTADPPGTVQKLNCIDCHNRVGHDYRSPDELLNALFVAGKLDYTLPFLKREAARLLTESYEDLETAKRDISAQLQSFYESNFPSLAARRRVEIDHQLQVILRAYEENLFPEMKADWREYPDHSQHKYSRGCFRCHGGKHVTGDGSKISGECTLCHDFYQEETQNQSTAYILGKYRHPWNLEKADHAKYPCDACHKGGDTPPGDCVECHKRLSLAPPPK